MWLEALETLKINGYSLKAMYTVKMNRCMLKNWLAKLPKLDLHFKKYCNF